MSKAHCSFMSVTCVLVHYNCKKEKILKQKYSCEEDMYKVFSAMCMVSHCVTYLERAARQGRKSSNGVGQCLKREKFLSRAGN